MTKTKQIEGKEIIQQLYNKLAEIKWYNDCEGVAGKAGYEWCIRDLMDILAIDSWDD